MFAVSFTDLCFSQVDCRLHVYLWPSFDSWSVAVSTNTAISFETVIAHMEFGDLSLTQLQYKSYI